jgi:hypothetical protein
MTGPVEEKMNRSAAVGMVSIRALGKPRGLLNQRDGEQASRATQPAEVREEKTNPHRCPASQPDLLD